MGQAIVDAIGAQMLVLADIRRELLKQNPDVLAITKVQGSNVIDDTNDHRVYFEVGGKPVTAYSILIYSTFTGTVALSPNSMSKQNDGILLAQGDVTVLPIAVDSLHIMTDGSNPCSVNDSSDASEGGFFIYAFTIADYERNRK